MATSTLDPNSTEGQSQAIHSALSTFFSNASAALANGGTFPTVSDIAAQLSFTALRTLATDSTNASPNFITGAAVETVHMVAGILREYGMRVKSKSEYYLDGETEHSKESAYYNSMMYNRASLLTGQSINGALTQ